MKVALVHDYLIQAGGAERVLRALSDMYPEAPIYTAFVKPGTAQAMFRDRTIHQSPWGWFLRIGRFYSYFRFLLPWVWKSVDLTDYDLVITSCSGYIARGFKVRADARVIAYCHTPPRWLYGYDTPTGAASTWWGSTFMWIVGPFVRHFDYTSAQRVDTWIANSQEVARRIKKFYRKQATVIYPPVEIMSSSTPVLQYSNGKQENRKTGTPEHKYYLLVTRVTGAKGVMEAVAAARQGNFKLKLVGEIIETRLLNQIKQVGDHVEYLGRVSDSELASLYTNARGFIALARDEDFGMTVVESMSYGTPVLAFNGGGYKETVLSGKTGIFIGGTDTVSVVAGIKKMEQIRWDRTAIKTWASQFSRARFEKEWHARVA